jgi:GTPase SAR1 family protein
MKKDSKFVLFKKLLIFGAKQVGKSSMSWVIENNKSIESEEKEEEDKDNNESK